MTPEADVIFSSNEMSVVEEPTTLPVAVLMTPEARLQELEDMKHLLSAQEYADKRSSILAAV
jgi:hypothetical protein